ncbi:hypothetical protein BU26DRAFT_327743 [Trematosphaeria pertusa]|uniref:Zn(2)-C6 fungal-type domain-containing protein n=1 Tax=Trematosphaeria pertusa TaxID=390896 RepID=A0A6A6IE12_9PLEO|nr:uncharacterized protein BU26DRAFT_327743 [Trematosphaeria pertusa]KAF2248132.1 hypothetical protein BU26DRAFT_327743 [Trematosphaeria pertusa]
MPSMYTVPRARACQSCAAAKAKCEPDIGYTKCKRCNKHGLDCVLKDPAPRKRRREAVTNDDCVPTPSPSPPSESTLSFADLVELERGLEYYRTALFQYFPFVTPPDLRESSTGFAKAKPFLSSVIAMLGCTQDRRRQCELAAQNRAYLASHVLQQGEKSLDLLQGLLLLGHWYHFQWALPNQRTTLIHLAMAMVVDLDLNRSPFTRGRLMTAADAANGFELRTEGLTDHTLEQKRTFLGCLYLSTAVSKSSLNMDAVRFSEYAERCCEVLEQSPLPFDRAVVYLVRLQHIVELFGVARSSLTQSRAKGRAFEHASPNIIDQADGPRYVKCWDQQLAEWWNAIPSSAQTYVLRIQYAYARVCLFECCLEESLFPSAQARLGVLRECLAAIRYSNDIFVPLSEQPMALLDVPSHLFAQSNHTMFVAIQLCSVKCGDWSMQHVERILGMVEIFEQTVQRMEGLFESMPENRIPEFYKRLIPTARGLRSWFAAKIRSIEAAEPQPEEVREPDRGIDELDFDFLGQFLNLDDSFWLQGLLTEDHPSSHGVEFSG